MFRVCDGSRSVLYIWSLRPTTRQSLILLRTVSQSAFNGTMNPLPAGSEGHLAVTALFHRLKSCIFILMNCIVVRAFTVPFESEQPATAADFNTKRNLFTMYNSHR